MIRTALLAASIALAANCAIAQSAPAKPGAKPAAAKKASPADSALPKADQTQIDAAERTYFGLYDCDFDQKIDVGMNKTTPGYVDVAFKGRTYTMKPIISSTGALRLEDTKGVALLIQIANKSMLMDTKAGKRLVDNCIHEKQRAFNAAAGK